MSEVAKINTPAVRRSTLVISPEQNQFSVEQVDALKKMNGWRDVPDAELSVFFHQAQRTGLDPFAKQIYLIGRYSRKNNRMDYTIQTSIDGMRLVADRTGRYAGSDRPRFGEEDGDRYAEVTVWKLVGNPATRVSFTGVAFESEFKDERSPMWKKMPKTMLQKTAEAQALRKAFPADLSGIYGQEEMDQAGPSVVDTGVESHAVEAEVVDEGQREPKAQNETPKLRKSGQESLRLLIEETGHSVEQFEEKIGPIDSISRDVGEAWIERLRKEQDAEGHAEEPPREQPNESFGNTLSEEEQREIEDSIDDTDDQRDATVGSSSLGGDLPATRKQLNYLETLVADVVEDGVGKFEEMVSKPMSELTRDEASEWVGRLSGRAV